MTPKIRKAVLPVAGLGTRFLPATKVIPKEMLPIVDKPLIQYAVAEAINAGIREFILVTRHDKASIHNHFKKAGELEQDLQDKGKTDLLQAIGSMQRGDVTWESVYQSKPLGLGHAVLCAREAVGNEPFAVILPDDLIYDGDRGCLKQMVDVFDRYKSGVIAVETVPPDETDKYGIVSVQALEAAVSRITAIVEKPKPAHAPSTLAVVGRYILPSVIFELLSQVAKGAGGEIQLTDAIALLLEREQVLAYAFAGKRYDCGSKLGYLQANVEYGLKDPDVKEEFAEYLSRFTKN
ncbi:MAG: UTP--glucose-1-phosphate uridylyltransferase GalU [Gammaproteobacteria bacterium]